jgi:hypothetical protein
VTSQDYIERLRLRAAYYHREAARSRQRARLIYCRALASHLEREAVELERLIKSEASSAPVTADTCTAPVSRRGGRTTKIPRERALD